MISVEQMFLKKYLSIRYPGQFCQVPEETCLNSRGIRKIISSAFNYDVEMP